MKWIMVPDNGRAMRQVDLMAVDPSRRDCRGQEPRHVSPRQQCITTMSALCATEIEPVGSRANIVLDGLEPGALYSGLLIEVGEFCLRVTMACEFCTRPPAWRSPSVTCL